jgi:hypothetical protein
MSDAFILPVNTKTVFSIYRLHFRHMYIIFVIGVYILDL